MSTSVPDNIKKNVRAVLLSKVGGVLVSDFSKDYKSLLKETLQFKSMGFSTMKEFIDAIPDVVRLQYDEQTMAYKMYGIGDKKTFMSLSMKRAEAKGISKPGDGNTKTNQSNGHVGQNRNANSREDKYNLVVNVKGLYTLCYPQNKEQRGIQKEEVAEKFSQFGDVGEVNIIPGLIFVRFCTKEGATAALDALSQSHELRVADEKNSKNKGDNNRKGKREGDWKPQNQTKKTAPDNDCLVGKKEQNHGNIGSPSSSSTANKFDVFIGNLDHACEVDDVKELTKAFSPVDIRVRSSKNTKKVFAFCTFLENQMDNANAMVNKLNGSVWKGRKINVQLTEEAVSAVQMTGNKNQTEKSPPSVVPRGNFRNVVESTGGDEWEDDLEDEKTTFTKPFGMPGQVVAVPKVPNPGPGLLPTPNVPMLPSAPILSQTSDIQFKLAKESIRSTLNVNSVIEKMGEITISTDCNSDQRIVNQMSSKTDVNMRSPHQMISPAASVHSQRSTGSHSSVQQQMSSPHNGMPRLERFHVVEPPDDMPQLEPAINHCEDMPPLSPIGGQPKVFIGGFPYGESDEELLALFDVYGAISVEVQNRNMSPFSTKATVTLGSWDQVEQAIIELDQTYFKGRRILVAEDKTDMKRAGLDIGYHSSAMNQQRYRAAPIHSSGFGPGGDNAQERFHSRSSSTTSSSSEEVQAKSFSSMLKTFNVIMFTLRLKPQHRQLEMGSSLYILITSVYDDQHFWGQIIRDDADLLSLQEIMIDLQDEDSRIGPTRGLGRCAAKFDGDWFRSWIVAEKQNGYKVQVFYLDYGNMALLDKRDTSLTVPDIWVQKPFLGPFRVTGPKLVTKEMENKLVGIRVTRSGVDETGWLTEVQIIDCNLED